MLIKERDEKATSNDFGFPPGCFILRSVSTRRLFDVASDSVRDGTPIILWPEKDSSLVESKSFTAQYCTLAKLTNPQDFADPKPAIRRVLTFGRAPLRYLRISEGFLPRRQRCPLRPSIRTRNRH